MPKLLTIAIPTYNRVEHLIKYIPYLLPQLNDECELVIIDNHSDYIVEEKLKHVLINFKDKNIRFVRNPFNNGLFGNILKCFEECKTKWLYIIGDDDKLSDNGLSLILQDIKNNSECLNISYQWHPEKVWSQNRPKLTHGMLDYMKSVEAIHNIMYLSSNVYNAKELSKYFKTGHYFQLTSAPHLVLLLMALDKIENAKVYLSNQFLVDNLYQEVDKHKTWDRLDFFRNNKLLLDLPLSRVNKKYLFILYKKSYPIQKFLWFYLNLKHTHKLDALLEFEKAINYYKIYSSFSDKFKIFICKILLLFPKLSIQLINVLTNNRLS